MSLFTCLYSTPCDSECVLCTLCTCWGGNCTGGILMYMTAKCIICDWLRGRLSSQKEKASLNGSVFALQLSEQTEWWRWLTGNSRNVFCLVPSREKPRPWPCAWPRPPTCGLSRGSFPGGRRALRWGGCGLLKAIVDFVKEFLSSCFMSTVNAVRRLYWFSVSFPSSPLGLISSLAAAGSGHAFTSSLHPPPAVMSGLPAALLWPLWHLLLPFLQCYLLLPPSRPHLSTQTHLMTCLMTHLMTMRREEKCIRNIDAADRKRGCSLCDKWKCWQIYFHMST